MTWLGVLLVVAGCYAAKVAGLFAPPHLLAHELVRRTADLLPVGLLAALVATGTFTTGHHVVLDARAAGLAAGVVALVLRAPFLVVIVVAAAVTALLRLR